MDVDSEDRDAQQNTSQVTRKIPPNQPSSITLLRGHETEVQLFCSFSEYPNEFQVFVCSWNPKNPSLLATGCVHSLKSCLLAYDKQGERWKYAFVAIQIMEFYSWP